MRNAKKSPLRVFLILTFILTLNSQEVRAKNSFFETLYDVPVLLDLKEIPEESLSFDKPSGRIASASAYSEFSSESDILSRYNIALFEMGWQNQKRGVYIRKNELLIISFEKSNTSQGYPLIIRFHSEPYRGIKRSNT